MAGSSENVGRHPLELNNALNHAASVFQRQQQMAAEFGDEICIDSADGDDFIMSSASAYGPFHTGQFQAGGVDRLVHQDYFKDFSDF